MLTKNLLTAALVCLIGHAAADEIRIGSVVGLTGPNASTSSDGSTVLNGYCEMINASGGINGSKVKGLLKDDQSDPAKTAALVEEIITKDKVVALVNAAGTANALAIMKSGVLNQHKVPLVGVFSGADAVRGPGSEQVFHTRAGYSDEVMKISQLASTIGQKRVALLYQDDGFGASINQSVAKASEQFKLDIVSKAPYKPGETDFRPQVRQIVAAKAQAIFLMGTPEAVIRFMKAYDAPVGAAQIYALSFIPAKVITDAVGEARVRGMGLSQVVPNPNLASLPLAKEFQAFLKTPYAAGVKLNAINFEVYMNIRLLVEAIRLAGRNPTPEKVTQALTSMNRYALAGYPISFSETNRRGSNYLDIGVIGLNGRLNY